MKTAFDRYAADYEATLNRALTISGESAEHFARARVEWLARCLQQAGRRVSSVLDFGCGNGSTTPLLREILGAERVLGVDPSAESITRARANFGVVADFQTLAEFERAGECDLVYCNGVFHHIAPNERSAALRLIRTSLRPGGLFSLWENNPWNPGTRLVMSRCDFDVDAISLSAPTAGALLRGAGFKILRTDFLFVFPRCLRLLRPLEPMLSRLPLGGQYAILSAA